MAIGENDETFIAEAYRPLLEPYPNADLAILPGLSHLGVVVSDDIQPVVMEWFTNFNKK